MASKKKSKVANVVVKSELVYLGNPSLIVNWAEVGLNDERENPRSNTSVKVWAKEFAYSDKSMKLMYHMFDRPGFKVPAKVEIVDGVENVKIPERSIVVQSVVSILCGPDTTNIVTTLMHILPHVQNTVFSIIRHDALHGPGIENALRVVKGKIVNKEQTYHLVKGSTRLLATAIYRGLRTVGKEKARDILEGIYVRSLAAGIDGGNGEAEDKVKVRLDKLLKLDDIFHLDDPYEYPIAVSETLSDALREEAALDNIVKTSSDLLGRCQRVKEGIKSGISYAAMAHELNVALSRVYQYHKFSLLATDDVVKAIKTGRLGFEKAMADLGIVTPKSKGAKIRFSAAKLRKGLACVKWDTAIEAYPEAMKPLRTKADELGLEFKQVRALLGVMIGDTDEIARSTVWTEIEGEVKAGSEGMYSEE
jgi:hypothetical protein